MNTGTNSSSPAPQLTWHACIVAAPETAYGSASHPQGMAQPWGRWALSFVPADRRPLAWIGRGPCLVGWDEGASFTGTLVSASRSYRNWAKNTPLHWNRPGETTDAPTVAPELADFKLPETESDPLAPQPADLEQILFGLGSFPFAGGDGQITVPAVALIGLPYLRTCLLWRSDFTAEAEHILRLAEAGDPSPSAPEEELDGSDWKHLGGTVPRETWLNQLSAGIKRLQHGEATKFVMARDEIWRSSQPVPVKQVLHRLISRDDQEGQQVSAWAFAIGNQVGASPEVLARTQRGEFACRILAGTTLPGYGPELFDDPKEVREHQVARDSVMELLTQAGVTDVQASEPSILSLPNVDHLQSVVTGQVSDLVDSATITEVFHPTAAICGMPRQVAMQLISQLEGMERGDFTGPVGIIAPNGDGQWNIALRCAQTLTEDGVSDPDSAQIKAWRLLAGAGILPASDPAREWDEMGRKMQLMRKALRIE
ncbi:chorismate-binding protein [Boudabousia marimammalium]|uniref:Chorismate-utilising enzyme C-terminal domain-containing protein n=1 Tax=Boudabousia marimammalium TaxID=156892 RepID=A0A1Q5PMG4_9ACTO|nr:chorismate-binding protein [Boudabousia marimammalium]OKL48713.1 hypothetical protein BM477_05830 [Boudabousia marimammalium]